MTVLTSLGMTFFLYYLQKDNVKELKKQVSFKNQQALSIDYCSERQQIYKHIILDSSYTQEFSKVLRWALIKDDKQL